MRLARDVQELLRLQHSASEGVRVVILIQRLHVSHIHRPGSSLQGLVSASAARLRSLVVVSLLRIVVLCEAWSEQRLAGDLNARSSSSGSKRSGWRMGRGRGHSEVHPKRQGLED
jgi:hypothetical protein